VAFGLPIALDVAGRHAVVVGGGVVGETRTRTLLEAGAAVTVISDRFTNGLQELSKRGEVTLLPRAYQPGDLEGAFLAVAATNSPHVNRRIHAEADELRVLLNAVDDSEHSHFAFPSVLRRGDLQVAISTGGRAPALARWLRKKLSRSVGAEYGELVDLLTTVRHSLPASVQRLSRSAMWARRWEQALDDDLLGLVRSGRTDQAPARARRHLLTGAPPSAAVPRVAIVGAGPGDAGLLTERARTLIDEADVVVYDRLVSPDLVEGKHAVYVGEGPGADPGRSGPAQAEINMLLVLFARQGKRVVRLNGGDPFVFGRGRRRGRGPGSRRDRLRDRPRPHLGDRHARLRRHPRHRPPLRILARHRHGAVGTRQGGALAGARHGRRHHRRADGNGGPGAHRGRAHRRRAGLPDAVGNRRERHHADAAGHRRPHRGPACSRGRGGGGSPNVIVIGEVVRLRDRIRWFDRDPEEHAASRPGSAREGQPT